MAKHESVVRRWWIYQRERFPLGAHGLLIAVFATSAIGYTGALQSQQEWPPLQTLVAAFIGSFGFFLLLRIADEFKDYEDDLRFRAYRPVPRGLISLGELRILGIVTVALQVLFAWWLKAELLAPYLLTFGYFLFMSKEFFAQRWLKSHALAYLFSHMIIMPLIAFYATAHQWLPGKPPMLAGFLAVSFFSGIVLEVGRKIRAPEMEETGVETYSALWGRPMATAAWLLALGLAAISCVYAASLIGLLQSATLLTAGLCSLALINALAFLKDASAKNAKRFEVVSGLWTLCAYGCLGILPMVI